MVQQLPYPKRLRAARGSSPWLCEEIKGNAGHAEDSTETDEYRPGRGRRTKCPNCGAENPENAVYCGSCATQLVEFRSKKGGVPGASPEPANNADSHERELRRRLRQTGLHLVLAEGLLALSIVSSIAYSNDPASIINIVAVIGTLFVVSAGLRFIYLSGNAEALAFMRLKDYGGEVLSEVNGFSISYVIGGVVAAAIPAAILLYVTSMRVPDSEVPVVISGLIALVVCLALVVQSRRSTVMLERGGLVSGSKNAPVLSFVPMEKIASMRIEGKLLKMKLVEDPVNLTKRRSYLLRGDISEFRTVVEKLAPGGEMMPGLAVIPAKKLAEPSPVRENVPMIGHHSIASLLIVSGVAIGFNGYALTELSNMITSAYGPASVPGIIPCCAIIEFIIAAIVFLGAVMAFRRRRADLVSAAAWLSIIGLGGVVVSPAIGIVSLLLLKNERDDFES